MLMAIEEIKEFYEKFEGYLNQLQIKYTRINISDKADSGEEYVYHVDNLESKNYMYDIGNIDFLIYPVLNSNSIIFQKRDVLHNKSFPKMLNLLNFINKVNTTLFYGYFYIQDNTVMFYNNEKVKNIMLNVEASDIMEGIMHLFEAVLQIRKAYDERKANLKNAKTS